MHANLVVDVTVVTVIQVLAKVTAKEQGHKSVLLLDAVVLAT